MNRVKIRLIYGDREKFSAAEIAAFKALTTAIGRYWRERTRMMGDAAERIMRGLKEALAHARGEEVADLAVRIPATVDVAAVRHRTGLSQAAFSRRIGVSPATLRNWEQGRRTPEGPARVLLTMLERNPRVVEETLAERPPPS